MVKQRGIIDAKYLIFYLKQELGLDALFGEGAGPETAEKGLLLVQTDRSLNHQRIYKKFCTQSRNVANAPKLFDVLFKLCSL